MAEIAAEAGVSRQAVYLHFQDRSALLLALLGQAEEELPARLAAVAEAPSARAAVAALVALRASDNPGLWPLVRMLDSLRQSEAGVEAAWRDRLALSLEVCRGIARRFRDEQALAPQLTLESATDLLASLTSLRLWEELVIDRGWSAERYRSHVTYLAAGVLTR